MGKNILNLTTKEWRMGGVYRVIYLPDGEFYIGCTRCFRARIKRYTRPHYIHCNETWIKKKILRLNGHDESQWRNCQIPQSWYAHIRENVDVEILEFYAPFSTYATLQDMEKAWIEKLNPRLNTPGAGQFQRTTGK